MVKCNTSSKVKPSPWNDFIFETFPWVCFTFVTLLGRISHLKPSFFGGLKVNPPEGGFKNETLWGIQIENLPVGWFCKRNPLSEAV